MIFSWLGREDSNIRMAESKSGMSPCVVNTRSEISCNRGPNSINGLVSPSERGASGSWDLSAGARDEGRMTGDVLPPNSGAKSVAERMRAYRRRRRRGLRCYGVQLGQAELDGLVAKGYLPSDKRGDRQAIELAIDDLLFDWLQG